MFDIIIIGAGVIGSAIARILSKYQLNILVLEKENDVGDGASGANSGIIHSGYDPLPGTKKAYLNVLGNKLYSKICEELNVKMRTIGSLTIATTKEEVEVIHSLARRADDNSVKVKILNRDTVLKLEPNITEKVLCALYAPSCGIVDPFNLTIALMENAIMNGVKLLLNQEVIDIIKKDDYFIVKTKSEIYRSKIIINASGVNCDDLNNKINNQKFTLTPRRGEYLVLDHFDNHFINHVLFSIPTAKGKGVLITPTTSNNYLIGPSSEDIDDKESKETSNEVIQEVINKAMKLLRYFPKQEVIRTFSGIRAISSNDDFIIEETSPNFINVAGISSPGLAAAPAIAQTVEKLLISKEKFIEKDYYNPYRNKQIMINELSINEKNQLFLKNHLYGKIICRCEKVTEGEIRDCLHSIIPPTTLKGVKKRIRPGAGRCLGTFCEKEVMRIIADYYQIKPHEVNYHQNGSYIILGEDHDI